MAGASKIDYKRELRDLYGARDAPAMVEVPELSFDYAQTPVSPFSSHPAVVPQASRNLPPAPDDDT